jgi:hypothetical protein
MTPSKRRRGEERALRSFNADITINEDSRA